MPVPNTFATATSPIPLADLDENFDYYDDAFQISSNVITIKYSFQISDVTDPTKIGLFSLASITTGTTRTYTLPDASGTLALLSNTSQTFTGTTTFSPATASGTLTFGAAGGTGTITLGRSTANQTTNIQAAATASGSAKTINIGTGGASGSTTTITYGSAVSGATVSHTFNANGGPAMGVDSAGRSVAYQGAAAVPTISTAGTGSTVTLTNATSHLLYNNATTTAALTVTLPSTGLQDGQMITIACRSAVTALTVNGGTIYGAPATLIAGGYASFIYSSTATAWFRKG